MKLTDAAHQALADRLFKAVQEGRGIDPRRKRSTTTLTMPIACGASWSIT